MLPDLDDKGTPSQQPCKQQPLADGIVPIHFPLIPEIEANLRDKHCDDASTHAHTDTCDNEAVSSAPSHVGSPRPARLAGLQSCRSLIFCSFKRTDD